jgi:hypothetical protein
MLDAGYDLSPASGLPLTSGHVLVGDSNNQAADVAMSGDATMDNTGALSIAATKLANSENSYIRTDVGTKDILAAAAAARKVIIVVTVTTVFANGDGAQPTLTIGEESGSATKFAATRSSRTPRSARRSYLLGHADQRQEAAGDAWSPRPARRRPARIPSTLSPSGKARARTSGRRG